MIERVLIYINAAPLAFVFCIDRNNTKSSPFAREMLTPKLRGAWLANDLCFACVFPVGLFFVYAISTVCFLQTIEDG